MKALLTADFDPTYQKKLAAQMEVCVAGFALTGDFQKMMKEDEFIHALQGADILVLGYEQVTQRVIRESPDLKLIASIRGGPEENIDVAAATAAGLPILRTIGRTQHPVSEQAILLMLALARPLIQSTQLVRAGQWSPEAMKDPAMRKRVANVQGQATELYGKTLGLVGMGNIGEAVAHLAQAFGMKVLVFDPYLSAERAAEHDVTPVDLNFLMSQSDYVSVHARVTPESVGVVGRDQLRAMKPTACLINTARAALVDTDALAEALREGWIRAAAVDVYDKEPPPLDNPLLAIPPEKLLLTTHLAGFSQERIPYHSEYLVRAINEYLHGVKPKALFDPTAFDQPGFAQRGQKLFGCLEKVK